MSTITVTNIQATGETASRAVSGVAAAWVVGTNSAGVTDSVNVSSGIDNATGNYSYSYTNNMSNSTWCFSGSCEVLTRTCTLNTSNVAKDSNSFDVRIYTDSGSADDRPHGGTVHGDLA